MESFKSQIEVGNMRLSIVLGILIFCMPLYGQEEADTVTVSVSTEDTSVYSQEGVLPEEVELEDTTGIETVVESELDTTPAVPLEDIPQTLETGYKGFVWGMSQSQLQDYVEIDSLSAGDREEIIVVSGVLGEDTVTFNYFFSDKGFWKVSIDYQLKWIKLEDYINHFSHIEKFLTKRYGPPIRTTQNEMGTDREFLFSDFPKLSRAYFRSSWTVEAIRIELLLDAIIPVLDEELPVFDDVKSLMHLYYYHPDFYEKTEPTTTEIPEETLIDAY